METAPTISSIGTLIGDPTRAVILATLLDGTAWTAGELAKAAGVTPQTISSHLRRLTEAGILRGESQGRHRYFRLSSGEVSAMLESLTALSNWQFEGTKKPNQRQIRISETLRQGRTCYDHLAGKLGIAISDILIQKEILTYGDTEYVVTDSGSEFFRQMDIDCALLKQEKRKFAHQCLDWSERRYHIAGALGSEILHVFRARHWLSTVEGSRAVKLTPKGMSEARSFLGQEFMR